MCCSLYFNQILGKGLQKTLHHMCFLKNFAKVLRAPILLYFVERRLMATSKMASASDVFHVLGFSGSGFFRVQVLKGHGFSGSRSRVQVQGLDSGFRSSNSSNSEWRVQLWLQSIKFVKYMPFVSCLHYLNSN